MSESKVKTYLIWAAMGTGAILVLWKIIECS